MSYLTKENCVILLSTEDSAAVGCSDSVAVVLSVVLSVVLLSGRDVVLSVPAVVVIGSGTVSKLSSSLVISPISDGDVLPFSVVIVS